MALVNPNIAMSYRAPEMPNQLANYAAMQQIQSGQRQGEAAQMQLDKMKRDEAALSTMMDTITSKGGPSDPMEAAQAMIKSRIPQYMEMGLKLQQTHRQLLQDRSAMGLPPVGGAAPVNAMAPASEPYPGYNESIGMAAPVNAMAPTAAAPAAPVNAMAAPAAKDAQIMQAKQMLLSTNPGVRIAGEQQLKALTSEAPDAALMKQLGYPLTQAGYQAFRDAQRQERMLTPAEEAQRVRIAAASRAPAAPRPEQPPVAVVDPTTGKSVFVSREQAISGRMAPAAAQESLPPKEIQKREAALPQATSAVTGFEKKTDSFVKDLTELRNHPGLSEITGIAAGRLPGITKEGRAAQALYDKVVAKGGFQALQDLRDASKTGGALGNVSNQEGKQLTASFSAIDRRQNVSDVQNALDTAIADVQGARTRMREAYDMTYAYKGGEAPTPRSPGAAPAAPNIDALLNKYK